MKNKKKLYFGWWILMTCFFLMALLYVTNYSLVGLFVTPMAKEFNTSTTGISTMVTISIMCSTISSFFAGKIIEKYNIKIIVLIACAVIGLAYLGIAFSKSIIILYLLAIPRGICGTFVTMVPISVMINNWFGKKIRGKAMGVAMIGSGIGGIVLSPITGKIIVSYGWRWGYGLFFVLAMLLLIPIAITFVRTPSEKNLKRIGDIDEFNNKATENQIVGLSLKHSLRTWLFWVAFLGIVSISGTTQTWQNLGASYIETIGYKAVQAAGIISIASIGNMTGKIILGAVCDKWGAKTGAVLSAAELLFGCLFLMLASKFMFFAYFGAILIGLGLGFVNVTIPLMTADWFGNKEYGTLIGYMHAASGLGGSILPLFLSMIYDKTINYIPVWSSTIFFCVFTILCVFLCYAMIKRTWSKYQ